MLPIIHHRHSTAPILKAGNQQKKRNFAIFKVMEILLFYGVLECQKDIKCIIRMLTLTLMEGWWIWASGEQDKLGILQKKQNLQTTDDDYKRKNPLFFFFQLLSRRVHFTQVILVVKPGPEMLPLGSECKAADISPGSEAWDSAASALFHFHR